MNRSGSASVVRNSATFVYSKFNSVSANNTLDSDLCSTLASQCCNIFEHRSLLVLWVLDMWSRCSLLICNWSPSSFQSVTICAMAPRCLLVSGSADGESWCPLVFTTTVGVRETWLWERESNVICDNCSKHFKCVCMCARICTVHMPRHLKRVLWIWFHTTS